MKRPFSKNSAIFARTACPVVVCVCTLSFIGATHDVPWLLRIIPISPASWCDLTGGGVALLLLSGLEGRPKARRFEAIFLLLALIPVALSLAMPTGVFFGFGSDLLLAGAPLILLRHSPRSLPKTSVLFALPLLMGASVEDSVNLEVMRGLALVGTFVLIAIVMARFAIRLEREERLRRDEEERHRASDDVLLKTLESIPTGVWILDDKGNVVRNNAAARNLIHSPRDVDIETGWVGRWVPSGEVLKPHEWPLTRLLREGKESVNKLIELETPTGSRRTLLTSAHAIRDAQGKMTGAIMTSVDVSTSFRLQKELGVLARVGEELIQLGPTEAKISRVAHIVVPDVASYCAVFSFDKDARLQWKGEASNNDPRAADFQRILHSYDTRELESIGIDTAVRRQRSLIVTKTMAADRQEPGQVFSFIVSPLIVHHGAIGAMLLLRSGPIHPYAREEKFVSEGIARLFGFAIQNEHSSEQLRKAVRAREDVVAIVSHDLRNPLDVVVNATGLVEEELEAIPEAAAKVGDLLRMIGSAAQRMHDLIQDLLDVSRIEAGRLELETRSIDLVSLVEENISFQLPTAEKSGLRLRFTPPRSLPPVVGDPSRISQVLGNLIGNAIKFTPSGGTIDLRVRTTPHRWVEVSVRDSGSGIKKEYLEHIFERYWQPLQSAKKGVGLGLFVVKGIVEAHGGRVWVASEEGRGSTFTFTLPLADGPDARSDHPRRIPGDFPASQDHA